MENNKTINVHEVIFNDPVVFGDNGEHYYDVECHDGYAKATKCTGRGFENNKGPEKLELTYPKREQVVNNKKMAAEVLEYRGLFDLTAKDINFSDIMIYYGQLKKVKPNKK